MAAWSMLSYLRHNMGLLCSRNRHCNQADTEENAQVSEFAQCCARVAVLPVAIVAISSFVVAVVCSCYAIVLRCSRSVLYSVLRSQLGVNAFPGCRN